MVIILKSVKVGLHFFKYLSLCPTKILLIVSFYVSFKPHLVAPRCHQTAVNGVLKFKFSCGSMPSNPPSTARRGVPRACVIDMRYGTFKFKLNPPPLENPGFAPDGMVLRERFLVFRLFGCTGIQVFFIFA